MKLGQSFEHEFEITESAVNLFLLLSNDKNPMHVNAEYAKKHGFKDKVVHGNVLGAYVSYFVGEVLPIKNIVIQKQDIAYHKPFFIGDKLKMSVVLKDIFKSVSTYLFKFRFFNQELVLIAKGSVQISKIS